VKAFGFHNEQADVAERRYRYKQVEADIQSSERLKKEISLLGGQKKSQSIRGGNV